MRFQRSSGVLLHVSSLASRGGIGEIHEAVEAYLKAIARTGDSDVRWYSEKLLAVEAEIFAGETYRLQGMAHATLQGNEEAIRYWAKRKGLRLAKSRKDHSFGLHRDGVGVFCDPQTGYGKNLDEVADWLHDNVGHLPTSDLYDELSRARANRERSGARDV